MGRLISDYLWFPRGASFELLETDIGESEALG